MVLNVPGFWIYQGSEYASSFEYVSILNIKYARVTKGSKYA